MHVLPIPAFDDNYIWLLRDAAGRALVVDPGDAAPVLAALGDGPPPHAILLTHHHGDHIGGVPALLARWPGTPVFAPVDERIGPASQWVADDEEVAVGPWRFRVLAVPGHTRSHVAYHGEGLLFCGDALFSLGCGRMFEGTATLMHASLARLAALPGDTRICCAHEYTLANAAFALAVDPGNPALQSRASDIRSLRATGQPTLPTRLDEERACNPFLRCADPAVRAAAERHAGRPLADAAEVFGVLRAWKDGFRAWPAPYGREHWPRHRAQGTLEHSLDAPHAHIQGDTMGFLQGKRALVTGIASQRSIATGIADAFHREGAELALTYQNEKLKSRVEDAAAGYGSSIVLPLDVADDAQIDACFAELGKHWSDGFDILVHCIAFAPREAIEGDFLDGINRERYHIAHDISAYSLAALGKAARPLMKGRNGSILTLSYLGAERALANYNTMGVAKASLEATVRYMAMALGPEGTRVNAISAGPIRTLAASGVANFRKMLSSFEAAAPLRRAVTIEDVGNTAAFLCSDLAHGITGEITYVDAGYNIMGMSGID